MKVDLKQGDCLELMKGLENESVDAIVTDPPFYKIRGDFDFIWKTFDEYLEWVELVAVEFKRILKPNGSLLWFGDDKNIAYCQIIFDKYFNFLNHLVWDKINPIAKGENNFRMFATRTERILYYACTKSKTGLDEIKLDIENFKSLRNYFKRVQEYIGLAKNKINEKLKHRKAEHCFYWKSTQWELPTPETYNELIKHFQIDKMGGFKRYEKLRQEYEELRRPFNYQKGVYEVIRHKTNSHITKENESHITQKPIGLMHKLIEITTNSNQTILDPFLGSGTTGIACANLNRNFIGYELSEDYFKIAEARIKHAKKENDERLF